MDESGASEKAPDAANGARNGRFFFGQAAGCEVAPEWPGPATRGTDSGRPAGAAAHGAAHTISYVKVGVYPSWTPFPYDF